MKEKLIFWNVDTQYDFMRNDENYKGKLPVKGAILIEENLLMITKYAENYKIIVINTGDWHTKKSKEISNKPDFITKFPKHCLIGTLGAEFVPATKPNPKETYVIDWRDKDFDKNKALSNRNIVLYKDEFDAFTGSPHTEELVRLINPKKAVIYGVATNVCVDYAVKGLLERKVDIYVPLDAIKELPNMPLPYKEWEARGAKLITTKDILEGKIK